MFEIPLPVGLLLVAASIVAAIGLAYYLARTLRMPDHGWKLAAVFGSVVLGGWITALNWPPSLGIDLSGGVQLIYEVDQERWRERLREDPTRRLDMDQLVEAVRLRVNPDGQADIVVRPYGAEEIEIIVPGADLNDAERIKQIVSSTGTLEFRILAHRSRHESIVRRAEASPAHLVTDEAGEVLAWWVPVRPGREDTIVGDPSNVLREGTRHGEEVLEVLVVNDNRNVTGEHLAGARRGRDNVDYAVDFEFDAEGTRRFAALTSDNAPQTVAGTVIRSNLGIILDGYLHSAPHIRETIHGRGQITGRMGREEVDRIVAVLNAGALPTELGEAPTTERLTGPTLGADTIRKGAFAISVSLVVVLAFMVVYYRFAGLVACFALLMTLLLVFAVMTLGNADFTLPGIAGLVLTVGMAVDANVLIFERIREELARGAALRMAIRNGFGRATTTIVDANLTTLITALVLYAIGTDAVKGFAMTLILGVTMSMFAAIFCSRVIFDVAERARWLTQMKMMQLIGRTNINFLAARRWALAGSLAILLVGLVGVGGRGQGMLDIDFIGGVSLEVVFTEEQAAEEVRERLAPELPDLAIADVRMEDEPARIRYMVNTSTREGMESDAWLEAVRAIIAEEFSGKLATNQLTISNLEAIEAADDAVDEAVSAVEIPAEDPLSDFRPRSDLPENLLAAADPAALPEAAGEPAAEEPGPEVPAAGEAPAEEPAAEAPPAEEVPAEAAAAEAPALPSPRGVQATLEFSHAVNHDTLRNMLMDRLADFRIFNEEYTAGSQVPYERWEVTLFDVSVEEGEAILGDVKQQLEAQPYFPSASTIGARVAGRTRWDALAAILTSLAFIVAYIWIRFQKVIFGLAAVVALIHDVMITVGILALSAFVPGPLAEWLMIDPFKIGLPVVAALLTIIGYSLNDTIIVFDRIREVRGKAPRLTAEMVNTSVNQTLARTLLTSGTTLLVVLILYVAGGQGIHAFAFTLLVGVLVGTYSSIYIAAPVLLWMSGVGGAAAVTPAKAREAAAVPNRRGLESPAPGGVS